jgi:hypothetical protein
MPLSAAATTVLPSSQPCVFEYRDQLFYIVDPALGFARAMSAETFFQTIANAVECSRQHRPWERPTAEIISFADHAAASGRPSK